MPVLGRVPYPTVSVEDAAKILRMNPRTIYRNMHEIPHTRVGNYYRIHVSFLFLEYVPPRVVTTYDDSYDPEQLEFTYDVPIRGVKRYRNGDLRRLGDYEAALSKKKWRNPDPVKV